MALVNCKECGKQVSDKAVACPNCGAPVSGRSQPATAPVVMIAPKSRSTAILLAMLLGGLGVHKFYLNRPGLGVLYLFFCWTLIPAIVSIFEGLSYLSMSDEAFQKQYGDETHRRQMLGYDR